MKTELPTKPGPYYWREKDGDEWEIHTVFVDYELNNTLMAFCQMDETWYAVENWGGQWLPIPPAEELVELRACKIELQNIVKANAKEWEMPNDEFIYEFHAWAVNRAKHVLGMHTCEPVTIVRKAKR
jgi:hypothetical protein